MKWAKNTMCEMDRESLMGDMTVARMQQEFARDPQRVPLVHNQVGSRLAHLLSSCTRTWPSLRLCFSHMSVRCEGHITEVYLSSPRRQSSCCCFDDGWRHPKS